jgi:hypothetical protein
VLCGLRRAVDDPSPSSQGYQCTFCPSRDHGSHKSNARSLSVLRSKKSMRRAISSCRQSPRASLKEDRADRGAINHRGDRRT